MSIWNAEHTVEVYSNGFCYCSVCAPKEMPIERTVAIVNQINPTGLASGSRWKKAGDTHFKSGEPVGCDCPDHSGKQHWLMVC